MFTARAFAASSSTSPLAGISIPRRDPGPDDVDLEILYCGVCHSDLHMVRNEWAGWPTIYPIVPGHEIVGRVTQGRRQRHQGQGRRHGGGRLHGRILPDLRQLQGRPRAGTATRAGRCSPTTRLDPDGTAPATYGGYSDGIVVNSHFVLRVSPKLDPAAASPLLCAGITLYSPLKHWGAGPGKKVGIVGLGGLGHMGVKFAHAFGAHTVLFTTSPSKIEDGKRLGADDVVISKNADEMAKHTRSFDLIVNTVAASHNLDPFIRCSSATARWCWSARPSTRTRRRPCSTCCSAAARWPARASAASRRRRRCSTSAPRRTSSRTSS